MSDPNTPKTLFQKIWDAHVVREDEGRVLLYVDLHLVHEVTSPLPTGVTSKDIILAIIGKIGTAGATGYVIEYTGAPIRALSMEARMTICNMSIEAGARAGMIAPDETTFRYLKGRKHAPQGEDW